jgi:hypothetical protein
MGVVTLLLGMRFANMQDVSSACDVTLAVAWRRSGSKKALDG